MGLYRTLAELPEFARHGVVVIGNFDGVHKGHQAVLAQARQRADSLNSPMTAPNNAPNKTPVTVLIFDPHPRQFFAPHAPSLRLTRLTTRADLLKRYGADHVLALTFDATMAGMAAEDFIRHVLKDALDAKAVCVGHDFHFGKNRAGTPDMLKQKGKALGFDVTLLAAVTPPEAGARPYSSTAIRECLTRGDVRLATALLGHHWRLEGVVCEGDKRGRTINFPTANVALDDYHLPLFGVYAVQVDIKTGDFATHTSGASLNKSIKGVANLGIRPSFDTPAPRLEAHLFDFAGDIYGAEISVALIEFIRPEQKFDGLDALKAQIAKDAVTAKQILAG